MARGRVGDLVKFLKMRSMWSGLARCASPYSSPPCQQEMCEAKILIYKKDPNADISDVLIGFAAKGSFIQPGVAESEAGVDHSAI